MKQLKSKWAQKFMKNCIKCLKKLINIEVIYFETNILNKNTKYNAIRYGMSLVNYSFSYRFTR